MYAIYKMKANELDNKFLKALKAMFKDKELEIVVCETSESKEDIHLNRQLTGNVY